MDHSEKISLATLESDQCDFVSEFGSDVGRKFENANDMAMSTRKNIHQSLKKYQIISDFFFGRRSSKIAEKLGDFECHTERSSVHDSAE